MRKIPFFSTLMLFAMDTYAFAFSVPSNGDLWFDFYDAFFNKILLGPLGFVGTGALALFCLYSLVRGSMFAGAIAGCAAACVYNLESVVTTMGYVI